MKLAPILLLLACTALASAMPTWQSPPEALESFDLDTPDGTIVLIREKRQNYRRGGGGFNRGGGYRGGYPGGGYNQGGFGQGGFGQGAFQNPGFSSSAANAQAQGFNAGNFGASSAGTQTQAFGAGPGGIQGSFGNSLSQNYRFPGLDINVAGANTFGVGPGGVTRGGSSAVTVNGQPFNG